MLNKCMGLIRCDAGDTLSVEWGMCTLEGDKIILKIDTLTQPAQWEKMRWKWISPMRILLNPTPTRLAYSAFFLFLLWATQPFLSFFFAHYLFCILLPFSVFSSVTLSILCSSCLVSLCVPFQLEHSGTLSSLSFLQSLFCLLPAPEE